MENKSDADLLAELDPKERATLEKDVGDILDLLAQATSESVARLNEILEMKNRKTTDSAA